MLMSKARKYPSRIPGDSDHWRNANVGSCHSLPRGSRGWRFDCRSQINRKSLTGDSFNDSDKEPKFYFIKSPFLSGFRKNSGDDELAILKEGSGERWSEMDERMREWQ
ncbi:conserved hypothetical protein [Ricinus communis]|uniref:Uncharacterized protein n=1 Tax=Ricinus communis TaxID=3988 RepID=B9RER5_RICCO|nr:conserved hypothetical protein [Ricinus communis]